VYDGVPTTITSWIAVVPKLSLLILFFNISISLNAPIVQEVVGSQFPV
jgi:NADH:ubiquinone oxidoreductase subunit 2 (subunit N)